MYNSQSQASHISERLENFTPNRIYSTPESCQGQMTQSGISGEQSAGNYYDMDRRNQHDPREYISVTPDTTTSEGMVTTTASASPTLSSDKSCTKQKQTKTHTCDTCGLCLSRADSLQRHQKVHSGERNYICMICNRGFALSNSLKQHIKTHTEERMHQCDFCKRRFARLDSLKRHLIVHSGRKEYACKHCPKSFALSTGLRQHSKVHTGEKVTRCDNCGKTFARKDSLQRHVRSKSKCTSSVS